MHQQTDLITVFETGNPALIAMAKSILDGADIAYFVKGENAQNLFGTGIVGTGFNLMIGPIQIQVMRQEQARASKLLSNLTQGQTTAT